MDCSARMLPGLSKALGGTAVSAAQAKELLWGRLAEGGHVVLMRHASVASGPGSGSALLRDPSCLRERRLSDHGKAEARALGQSFRRRGIPVGEVLHSPYCRTTATAHLAFESGTPLAELTLLDALDPDDASRHTATLRTLIASHHGRRNLILVTHEPNIVALTREHLAPAAFLVLQPRSGDFEALGLIGIHPAHH